MRGAFHKSQNFAPSQGVKSTATIALAEPLHPSPVGGMNTKDGPAGTPGQHVVFALAGLGIDPGAAAGDQGAKPGEHFIHSLINLTSFLLKQKKRTHPILGLKITL